MPNRKYYEAYDDRYRQVHAENLRWFADEPSEIVAQVIEAFRIRPDMRILEIGCGEGRDARPLLRQGFNLLATDISPEAVSYCQRLDPDHAGSYRVLDCVSGQMDEKFGFIYAVAVLHMLVEDADRASFYRFIREHLTPSGIALICTMGDGTFERSSDVSTAFDLQERTHEQSGKAVRIAGTSCRIVSSATFENELAQSGFAILEQGSCRVEPDFPQMMYAVAKGAKNV